jgi:putative lipoic acid-binding regulatory protein
MTKDGPGDPKDGSGKKLMVLGAPGTGSPEAEEQKPLIEYPATYTFKVMGKQEHGFLEYVRVLFTRLMGQELARDAIQEQPSSKGRYVSLSVSVRLESEEHRRSIYAELHRDERVIYYL